MGRAARGGGKEEVGATDAVDACGSRLVGAPSGIGLGGAGWISGWYLVVQNSGTTSAFATFI